MNSVVEIFRPVQRRFSVQSARLGVIVSLVLAVFALFLPWASIPGFMSARGGDSSSGWAEAAYLPLLPFTGLILGIFWPNRRPVKPRGLLICIGVSFLLLTCNDILFRTTWRRATDFSAPVGPADFMPHELGSSLDSGFWLGSLAIMGLSMFGMAWSLHKAQDQ